MKSVKAQIIPDATLGAESSVVTPNQIIKGIPSDRIDGGAIRGGNLFHSFQELNIDSGRGAYFTNPSGIENILTRVTGNNRSEILGTLGVLGNANLFFINPNGIIFGANARLDVNGSFVGTTANSIGFGNQGFFSATNPQPPSDLLTINPSAFFFNQLQGGRIESRSNLQVPDSRSLLLVGGDITIDRGGLNVFGGRVELAGLAGNGTVGLDVDGNNLSLSVPDDVARANVSLVNGASVNVTGGGGGSITVNARNLDVRERSFLFSGIRSGLGTPEAQAGDITINATDKVIFDGEFPTGAFSEVASGAVGNAGNVFINTGVLEVLNGAQLSADTFGEGDAGSVKITATDSIKLDGQSSVFSTVNKEASGNGSNIEIQTGSLFVSNGSRINASTNGKGNAGSVTIIATDSVKFDGEGQYGNVSAAYSDVNFGAEGNAGGVSITTGSLEVLNGAVLSADTFGKGDAGSVTINATDLVKFDGEGKDGSISGAFSQVERGAEGNAGGVSITTGFLEVTNGAALSANTFGKGNAGSVTINATDLVKFKDGEGQDGFISGAFSRVEPEAVGNAGGVSITTGSLEVTNGAELSADTFGKGNAGSVTIIATDSVKFDGEGQDGNNSGAFSRVSPEAEGNAGGVSITTGSLEVTNGAALSADTFGKGNAGSVTINATNLVKFDGEGQHGFISGAFSRVSPEAVGNAGGVFINTNFLEVLNGAELSADTFGKGNAGSVTINATDLVKFDGEDKDGFISGAFSRVSSGAEGNAGGVSITTGSLEVTNGAQLDASTLGKGDAGSVTINATNLVKFDGEGQDGSNSGAFSRVESEAVVNAGGVSITTGSLEVTNGAGLSADTLGKGNAGSVTINATNLVKFDGEGQDGSNSGAFSQVSPEAVGNAGGVFINTNFLEVLNGAELSADTFGKGNAGSVTINATDLVKFDGEDKDGFISGAFSRVSSGAEGNAGGVSITTGSLEVTNGAVLSASTLGKGDAGSVTINATDLVKFDGEGQDGSNSGAGSQVSPGAVGNAGGVSITTGFLEVTNGAVLSADTFGKGNAGNVSITATDLVKFDGEDKDGFASGAFSQVSPEAVGNAGGVFINTNFLEVLNGAVLSADTFGKGNAGSVTINANTFKASNGSKLVSRTSSEFPAGNIILKVKENITLSGSDTGIFANTTEGSTGKGGSIIIDPRTFIIRDGATISANSQGEGIGGDIELAAGFLTLDNGTISAQTRSNTGGNITLNLQDLLLLRNGSQITTTAGNQEFGGDGGNIIINSPFIVAVPKENSDITANAFSGYGGNINIFTQGIFGIEFQARPTQQSGITASSELGISGNVAINTPEVDPAKGLVELPTNLVDPSGQIDNSCRPGSTQSQSSFVATGRGGLPLSATEPLQDTSTLAQWVKPRTTPQNSGKVETEPQAATATTTSPVSPPTIVEASGWVVDANANIHLVAQAPPVNPSSPWQTSASCPVR